MKEENEKLFIQMAITQWRSGNEKVDKFFSSISNDQYESSITKDSNTAAWILCHLVYINDNLFTILGLGNTTYPKLLEITTSRDVPEHKAISKEELRLMWVTIKARLSLTFEITQTSEWFDRPTSVSEEDFKKEPHRNKLNVLLSHTNHQAHHIGQLFLIKIIMK